MTGMVKEQPLRKTTSAAYTVGRYSISDGFAVDCHVGLLRSNGSTKGSAR